ncbi:MAG: sigma 54-dependent Fis family transcriptional regulator [Myxococcales bacterium]|nr:sigma 54-dependent Fis family transcriptional regulator [Myxococcales bacterium]
MSEGTHIGTRAASPLVASPDGAMVVVLSGSKKGTTFRIGADARAVVKVGKAPDNDIVLDDDTVSRHHLTVARVPEGLLVRDLGSTNGVRVGGARIKEALVDPGTVVRAGEVELAIRLELSGVEVPASSEKRFGTALGQSLAMRRIFGLLERIAPTVATVLLTGETGTGKDVLARSIHEKSPRASASFEVVDCGAVAHNLIESELFGHERGAFTGAIASRAGAFERAAGGTIFLDEIGELPLELQPKLLRVLEAKELRRVGGNKTLTTDARVVAATTRDLAREVERGKFREDLFFRLAVVPIHVPPLRARAEDIEMLARRILDAATPEGLPPLKLPESTLAALRAHDWPGNVRELRNVLERAAYLARAAGEEDVRMLGMPTATSRPATTGDPFVFDPTTSYRDARAKFDAQFERRYVTWLLERHGGNISAAAREAQMDRKHLSDLARRHGLGGAS